LSKEKTWRRLESIFKYILNFPGKIG
jgi:hypothetical protein